MENTYQEKFDDNIFEEALNTVNNDLSEKALKKSLMKQIEPGKKQQQKSIVDKRKKIYMTVNRLNVYTKK